jgi:hypothetical protein
VHCALLIIARDDPEEDFQDAQDALEEMAEQEEEEQELEEVSFIRVDVVLVLRHGARFVLTWLRCREKPRA